MYKRWLDNSVGQNPYLTVGNHKPLTIPTKPPTVPFYEQIVLNDLLHCHRSFIIKLRPKQNSSNDAGGAGYSLDPTFG